MQIIISLHEFGPFNSGSQVYNTSYIDFLVQLNFTAVQLRFLHIKLICLTHTHTNVHAIHLLNIFRSFFYLNILRQSYFGRRREHIFTSKHDDHAAILKKKTKTVYNIIIDEIGITVFIYS